MKADALVLFGATGDLAKKKLFPALYDLEELNELDVKIIGVASSKWTQEVFRENVEAAIRVRKPDADEKVLSKLLNEMQLLVGDYENPETFVELAELIKDFKLPVIYLAIAPEHFAKITQGLATVGVTKRARVVVEKPFTNTSAEAKELIELSASTGKVCSVYQNRRYVTDFLTMKKIVDGGREGVSGSQHGCIV